jgi:nucleotide-binding universal stress UspA family protein
VLLASAGQPLTAAAIAEAARLAATQPGARVRVITIARVHGSALGLQHPGLMPNKKEKDAAQAVVANAIKTLQRSGLKADGEVVITRSPARSFTRAARAAGVTHVVVDKPGRGRLAGFGITAIARYVRFRLPAVTLTVI